MNKKLLFALIGIIFFLSIYLGISLNNKKSSNGISLLTLKNIEALAISESGGESGNAGACCKNGYKTWNTVGEQAIDRKQEFKNCWCEDKEGYNPKECSC